MLQEPGQTEGREGHAFSNYRCGKRVMKSILCLMTIIVSFTRTSTEWIKQKIGVKSTRDESEWGENVFRHVCAHVCAQDWETQQFHCGRPSLGTPVPSTAASGPGYGVGTPPKINTNPGSAAC